MVVGHTIQDMGVNGACDGKVLRVDVGMSQGCGNHESEVVEILNDGKLVRRLRSGEAPEIIGGHPAPAGETKGNVPVQAAPADA